MHGRTLIHGDLFVPLADVVYAWRRHHPIADLKLLRCIERWGNRPVVVYTDTDHADRLNRVLHAASGAQVVLVTHNGDGCVRAGGVRQFDADYALRAPCVRWWFAQNADINDEGVSPLPIGLERPHLSSKLRELRARLFRPNARRHLLYVNHAVETNPGEREKPYRLFEGKPYARVRHGRNGMDYTGYLDDLSSSAYCISPAGNGLDCHRTWEAMYLGCVPIIKREAMSERLYGDLPVLIVDDFEQVTEPFLASSLARFPPPVFARAPLFLEYYRDRIGAVCARKLGSTLAQRLRNRFWR